MYTFSRSKSLNQRTLGIGTPRTLSFGSPRVRFTSVSRWFRCLVVIGALVPFSITIVGSYFYLIPSLTHAVQGFGTSKTNDSIGECNLFEGNWGFDDSYPLYNASDCPFAEQGFDCLGNGRSDTDYLRWRWKPKGCDIPQFNVHDILKRLRNKRVVFVGDSMSRTQWESLICLLMSGVEDKTSVYEVNRNKITKRIRFLCVRFESFNFTVEFFRSVFLVQRSWMPARAPRRIRSTLRLDRLDEISNRWVNSDILIFNTGQWWVPGKLFDTGCFFQVGNLVKLGMSIPIAFRMALNTWASWIEERIDTNRTQVFFRAYEPSHWSDLSHRLCNVTELPMSETGGRDRSIFSDTILEVVKSLTVPVTVLQITSMSAFRFDAHVGKWNGNPIIPDCSHWCLPGVPDTWNEIVFSYLLSQS